MEKLNEKEKERLVRLAIKEQFCLLRSDVVCLSAEAIRNILKYKRYNLSYHKIKEILDKDFILGDIPTEYVYMIHKYLPPINAFGKNYVFRATQLRLTDSWKSFTK